MSNYNKGDVLVVKADLKQGDEVNEFIVIDEEQLSYAGVGVTLVQFYPDMDGWEILEDAGKFLWHESMLVSVSA